MISKEEHNKDFSGQDESLQALNWAGALSGSVIEQVRREAQYAKLAVGGQAPNKLSLPPDVDSL